MKKRVSLLFWSLLIFALLISTSCSQNQGQIILINNSNEIIKLAHIEACNQVIEIENIDPHEQAVDSFKIRCEGHYDISVTFASGKEIKEQVGYFGSGWDLQQDTFSINEANITLVESKVE